MKHQGSIISWEGISNQVVFTAAKANSRVHARATRTMKDIKQGNILKLSLYNTNGLKQTDIHQLTVTEYDYGRVLRDTPTFTLTRCKVALTSQTFTDELSYDKSL